MNSFCRRSATNNCMKIGLPLLVRPVSVLPIGLLELKVEVSMSVQDKRLVRKRVSRLSRESLQGTRLECVKTSILTDLTMLFYSLNQLQITLEMLKYRYILDILEFRCVKAVNRFYEWLGE